MEFPDIKIEWIAEWLAKFWERKPSEGEVVGGITQVDVQAYLIIIGIFMISWSWRQWGKKIDKVTTRLEDYNKNQDNHTDAILDNTRSLNKVAYLMERENANNRKF